MNVVKQILHIPTLSTQDNMPAGGSSAGRLWFRHQTWGAEECGAMINQWRPDQVLMYSHTMLRNPAELDPLSWFPHQLVFHAALSALFVHRFLNVQHIPSVVTYKTMVSRGSLPKQTRWVRTWAGTRVSFPAPCRSLNWTVIVRCNWYNVIKRASVTAREDLWGDDVVKGSLSSPPVFMKPTAASCY